jgi:hypothetical protein
MFVLVVSGCSSDPTTSDEYQALEADLASTGAELASTEAKLASTEAELTSTEAHSAALAVELAELEATVVAAVGETADLHLAATYEVIAFLDAYHQAFGAFDVDAVLGMYATDGEWINDTPPGRDVYYPEDGAFGGVYAYTGPIGGFVQWLETVDFAFDSRGEVSMITNQAGRDVYVSYPSSWHFTYMGREFNISAFTVMWLVDTDDGLKVKRHWNLTPQTALSP